MMPKPVLLLFLTVALFAACKKNSSDTGSGGCITRTVPLFSDLLVSPADYDTVSRLFQANNIPLSITQPTKVAYYQPDSSGSINILVSGRRFRNGLVIRYGTTTYRFYNGNLADSSASGYEAVPETSDTTAHLGLDYLRKAFLDSHPENYSTYNTSPRSKNSARWADSCVEATLMYDDKGNYEDNGTFYKTLVKIWSIHTHNDGPYRPLATILDESGKVYPTYYISLF